MRPAMFLQCWAGPVLGAVLTLFVTWGIVEWKGWPQYLPYLAALVVLVGAQLILRALRYVHERDSKE